MAMSTAFQRFMDNAAPHLAGAIPSAIQAELFETLRDFLKHTNVWAEDVEIDAVPGTLDYEFTVPNGGNDSATGGNGSKTATILSGGTLSSVVDFGVDMQAARLTIPATFTTADLTFLSSTDGVTYDTLRDDLGNVVMVNVAASYDVDLNNDFWTGVRYLRVQSSVAQATSAILTFTTISPEYGLGDSVVVVGGITATQTMSPAIDIGDGALAVRIVLGSTWTPSYLTFQTSADGVTYNELRDDIGNIVSVNGGPDYDIDLADEFWRGVRYLKIRSGTSGTPVAQASNQIILVTTLGLPAGAGQTGGAAVSRLVNFYTWDDPNRRWYWPAELRLPNTISLGREVSSNQTFIARVSLYPLDPVDSSGNPVFPEWILDHYFDTLFSGTLWRMMAQPNKPYSNAGMAAARYRMYIAGRGIALSETQRSHSFNTQGWAYPIAGITSGRQRGA